MIKLGFIGGGGINRHHAKTIRENVKGITLSAVADISQKALKEFKKQNPEVTLYQDYRKMLAEADINAVCIGLPTGLHKEAAVAAARAKKHVFCEKPMAMTLKDTDAMIDACKKSKVRLMIGQVRRYDNTWLAFKKIIESGAIGRPVLWRHTAGGAGPGRWFMDAKMGGGPFIDGAVHNWDFANYTLGKAEEVIGSIFRLRTTTALDTGAVIVRYKSGDEVLLSWSWGLPAGCNTGGVMEAIGPKGIVKFPGTFSEEDFKKYDTGKYGAFLLDTGKKKKLVKFRKNNMFADEWKDFRDAIKKNQEPKVTGAVGKEAVAVSLAVLKAGETRKPVKV